MEEFKNLKRVAMSELKKLDASYANKDEFSESDARKYDCMMHGLKSQLAVEGMLGFEEEEHMEEYTGGMMSGRRGRAANGRFVSRDGGSSYAEGYSQGYSEGMRQSGHFMMPPGMNRDPRFNY